VLLAGAGTLLPCLFASPAPVQLSVANVALCFGFNELWRWPARGERGGVTLERPVP